MIFTRTKRTAQKVADELAERGFKVGAVHGDLGQIAREKALKAFRTGDIDVLVATDVAARGIDIDDITHVINYQIPEDEQAYVHRIGRTGRAGKTGIAITLVDWDELDRWSMIDKALGSTAPTRRRPTPTRRTSTKSWASPPTPRARIGGPRKCAGQEPRRRSSPPTRPARPQPVASAHPRRRAGHRDTSRGGVDRSGRRPTAEDTPTVHRGVGVGAARATPRAKRRLTPLVPDGQTRTPHQGRSRRRGDDRAGRRHGRPVLVEQRRAGHDQPAGCDSGTEPDPAQAVPDTLRQLWTAASPRPRSRWWSRPPWSPVTATPSRAATRRPGRAQWTFARHRPVRGVLRLRPRRRGLPRRPRLRAGQQHQRRHRPARPDPHRVRRHAGGLSSNGSTVLSAGPTRLELWRSDMVRMLSYGEIDARVKPVNRGIAACTLMSAAASDEAVSVLEACRDQKDLRLTLLKPAKEEDEPDTKNVPLPGRRQRLRGAGAGRVGHHHRGVPAHAASPRSPSSTTPAPRSSSTLLAKPACRRRRRCPAPAT